MSPSDFSRPGSLYGAVDLGARKAAAEAAARRQTAASGDGVGQPAPAGAHVIDVTEETFNTEVVERSLRQPVIVDLWADWCQPCKQLSPILERLAEQQYGGAWTLAKIDVDANPQIQAALRVQALPTILAIFQGQPVHGFQGALPEEQVKQWLDQLFEALDQYLQQGAAAPDQEAGPPAAEHVDPDLDEAEAAIDRGDLDAAAAAYEKVLARSPRDEYAKSGLAQIQVVRRVQGLDQATVQRAAAADPGDIQAQCQVADFDMLSGRVEEAFDRLIGAVRRTSGEERDQVRTHLLGLFEVLPADDPRLGTARKALTSALF